MLPSKTRIVSRAEDSSQIINTLRKCRSISTNTYRGSEASTRAFMIDDRRQDKELGAEGNTGKTRILAGKDLRNNRIGVQHGAVKGVWRVVHTPVAFTPLSPTNSATPACPSPSIWAAGTNQPNPKTEKSKPPACTKRVLLSWLTITQTPPPVFFVSVASKGLSQTVSLLFATLAWRCISVAAKGLKAIVGSGPDRVPTGPGSSR